MFPSFQWLLLASLVGVLTYWAWFVNAGRGKAHARFVLGSQIGAFALGVFAVGFALAVPLSASWHDELLGSGFGWAVVAALNYFGVRLRLARLDRQANDFVASSQPPEGLPVSSGAG